MYLGLDVALATWYNKKQHGFIPKEIFQKSLEVTFQEKLTVCR